MRTVSAALILGIGLAVAGACAPKTCKPRILFNDCSHGETCDAETDTCVEPDRCTTSSDCPGGYACQDNGRCATSCVSFVILPDDYCAYGYTCDTENWACKPGRNLAWWIAGAEPSDGGSADASRE